MSKMMGFQLGVILLYAFCLSTQVVSQTTVMAGNYTNASAPNSTMVSNSYTGNTTTNSTMPVGAAGSLHAGLSSLLPSVIAAACFLQCFC